MSDRHIECATCKAIRSGEEARNIPTWQPDTASYVDGYYCREHASAALEAARTHIATLDLEDDERDDMAPMIMLLVLLRAREMRTEDLGDNEAGGEGMEHVRQQVLALLARLAAGARLPIVEASALCSGCFRALPVSQIRVLPWHNESVDNYVTTFRCGECFPAAIAETRAHLEAGGEHQIGQLAEFFGRHAVFIHEHRRGDPPAVVRPILLHTLDLVASGALTLSIGETVPLAEILASPTLPGTPVPAPAASSVSSISSPAEPATASPSLWSRLFGRKST